MKLPVSYRNSIPFFCDKSEKDFQRDVYERYDSMVVRQSALHLADQLWGMYPMQNILDFSGKHYPKNATQNILEIGCGVGRWIATLAQNFPQATCWGIDYSYQMLRRANEFWISGRDITIDLSKKGFQRPLSITGHQLINLKFGLARATDLPFSNSSQDLILNSFLFDRLDKPIESLVEMYRVLKLNGKLIMVTPLNFDHANLWETLYPSNKIRDLLLQIGFKLLEWKENLLIVEPLDSHGNRITWKCLGVVACKVK